MWRPGDAEALAAAWLDDEVCRWLHPPGDDLATASSWIAGEAQRREAALALDIVIDVGGAMVGEVGFSGFDPGRRACLVGYWLDPAVRGRGLAAAALVMASRWFIDATACSAVLAQCDPGNTRSHRVAQSAGFSFLGNHDGHVVYAFRS